MDIQTGSVSPASSPRATSKFVPGTPEEWATLQVDHQPCLIDEIDYTGYLDTYYLKPSPSIRCFPESFKEMKPTGLMVDVEFSSTGYHQAFRLRWHLKPTMMYLEAPTFNLYFTYNEAEKCLYPHELLVKNR